MAVFIGNASFVTRFLAFWCLILLASTRGSYHLSVYEIIQAKSSTKKKKLSTKVPGDIN